MIDQDLDVTTVLHHRPLIKEFPLLSPDPPHSNANLGPRKEIRWRPLRRFAVDQLVAKARASLEPINAAIARIRAVASEIATAVNDRPCRWPRTSILYVAAFSSIAMLGVFVICTSFVSSPDVLAQVVNGGSPAGAPQAQRPPTPTSKLLQPNHDPKEVGSPPSPANVTPSAGSRQPVVRAVPPQVDPLVSGVRNTPSMSVQAGRPRAVERNVGQRITIAGGVLVLPEVAYYGVPVILNVPGLGFVDVPEEEYTPLYERLASSDPEQIEAAMVSLRGIKAAEDLEIEAAQRRPALSTDDTYLERDLSEPISFDRPSSSSRRPGRSVVLY
jgi:hypothetical protein